MLNLDRHFFPVFDRLDPAAAYPGTYNLGLVVTSVAIAVAFLSLSIRFHAHRLQSSPMAATMIAASVMGCAVAGMHYTAMQASIFFPLPDTPTYSMALSPTLLALLITIFTVLIAVSTLVATFAGRQSELAESLSAEISRRERTEEDLRRSEAYLAEAQKITHTGSWAYDVATRRVTYSSEEHYRLFGFDPAAGNTSQASICDHRDYRTILQS